MAKPLTCNHGAKVCGLQNLFLINPMNITFYSTQKPRSHLDSLCSQHECCRNTAPIRNSSCCYDRKCCSITHLRYQHHSCELTHMSTALAALGYKCRSSEPCHELRHGNRGNNRNHFNSCVQPFLYIFRRIACSRGNHIDLFLYYNLCHLICTWA